MYSRLTRFLLPAAAVIFLLFVLWVIWMADGAGIPAWLGVFYRFPYGDKVGHFFLIGGIAFFLTLAWPGRRLKWGRLDLPLWSALTALGAVLEEFSQLWFIQRSFDLGDLAAGLLGIACAVWLAGKINSSKSRYA